MQLALLLSAVLSLLVARTAHAGAVADWNPFAVATGLDVPGGACISLEDLAGCRLDGSRRYPEE